MLEKYQDSDYFIAAMSYIRVNMQLQTHVTQFDEHDQEFVNISLADGRTIQIPKLDLQSN